MRTAKMFIGLIAAISVAAVGWAGTFTYTISDVTNAPAPDGSYDDGTFIHGLNKFTFDVLFSLTPTSDDWTVGGVHALTNSGATWYYSPAQADPNQLPTAPGTNAPDKFSTFVNNPASQFSNARFTAPTAFAGGYRTQFGAKQPTYFDWAWLESPPVTTSLDTDAAVIRLTLSTVGTPFTNVRAGTTIAPGETQLASIQCAMGSAQNGGNLSLLNFNLYGIPEPAPLGLVFVGAFLWRRFR